MAKRSKKSPNIKDDIPNPFKQYSYGSGLDRLIKFGELDPQTKEWLAALDAAEDGDKLPLIDLMMKSPDFIVQCIGELIKNYYHFKKSNGRPPTPLHRMTDKEVQMHLEDVVNPRRGPERRIKARTYDAKRRPSGAGK